MVAEGLAGHRLVGHFAHLSLIEAVERLSFRLEQRKAA